jgi:hypothetical protein
VSFAGAFAFEGARAPALDVVLLPVSEAALAVVAVVLDESAMFPIADFADSAMAVVRERAESIMPVAVEPATCAMPLALSAALAIAFLAEFLF